ncbi:hypothetical protein Daesc_003039 [Daldinia eschscholtzii]|uniref:Uncharacterized protein n=1 Tax=Daldinia eschscholtzii TaxID=292717 RepID=A0AAX6MT95_9PEZI
MIVGTAVSSNSLLRTLQGVAVATKSPQDISHQIIQRLCPDAVNNKEDSSVALSFNGWREAIDTKIVDEDTRQVAYLGLAIAYLRELYTGKGDDACEAVSQADLDIIWELVRNALTNKLVSRQLFTASRSAQGFVSVALCSLIKDGNIDELFRLHVWLTDGYRGNPDVAIHSHQAFAQSWILAGEGTDHAYKVEHVDDLETATHAEYALAWSDGKNLGTNYKTNQAFSTITNTKKLVRVAPAKTNVHRRGVSYTIPAAQYHSTEVVPDRFHATLFVFDSRRGFVQDAGVLGPKDGDSFTQLRDPAGITPETLAWTVDAVRSWEVFMEEGQKHINHAEWEHALREFSNALSLCDSGNDFPNKAYHTREVLYRIGRVNRCLGRYEIARDTLEKVITDMEVNVLRVDCVGELGVVYRHLNNLTDAMRMFEMQYHTARQLGLEAEACRAVGNLGMVNYQISQRDKDEKILDLAIVQLQERVQLARSLQQPLDAKGEPRDSGTMKNGKNWEIIGLSRLSLCLSARNSLDEAVKTAQQALALVTGFGDPTVVALTRFFYGHALRLSGRLEEAMEQFNTCTGCTPAIALCKEPSEEHLGYLKGLVSAGVDLQIIDEQGYTALDYAVFSGNDEFKEAVVRGLQKGAATDYDVEAWLAGARLRKSYRKLFQDVLRPILLARRRDADDCMPRLRSAYAGSLRADAEARHMFSEFSFVPYSAFRSLGRLPKHTDGLVKEFRDEPEPEPDSESESKELKTPDFVIFFSYRWRGASSPDDESNTQYKRMLAATEEFLKLHPAIDRARMGIWLDCACINQSDPMPGVHALPMILTQCDAVISIADDLYYDRAWCSVEILLIQTLKKSYGLHLWYEQVYASPPDESKWILRDGPVGLEISIAQKKLSFEHIDRPKVMFLERQSKLLG